MKSIDEYTSELKGRIEQKNKARAKNRARVITLCASLALIIGAAALALPMLNTKTEPVTINSGWQVALKVDSGDKFVLNNADYGYDKDAKPMEDRDLYRGLCAFSDNGELYFSLYEDGPIYGIDGGNVVHVPGKFENGVYFGAAIYDGFVYMPATEEIICGDVRANGICRYNIKTQETESVIASEGIADSVTISGSNMFYVTSERKPYHADLHEGDKLEPVTVKMCDLSTGTIYSIATVTTTEYTGVYGTKWFLTVCGDRLVLLDCGTLYCVTIGGDVTKLTDGVRGFAADGDKIYVCREVERKYESKSGYMRYTPHIIEVYSAISGEKLGEFDAGGYQILFTQNYGWQFIAYDGKLAAVKGGSLYLIDVQSGDAKKVLDGDLDRAYAASVGDRLLVVNETGYENRSLLGDVWLISGDEVIFKGELPDNIFGYESIAVRYDSLSEAVDELLYESVDVPVDLKKLDVEKIYGHESVRFDVYGEHREKNMGVIYVEAQYDGKRVDIHISQNERVSSGGFAEKLGYGDYLERMLFSAESLPITENMPDGVLTYDLITRDGEPRGIFTWFDDENGETVDSEIRLLCETEDYTAVVTVMAYGIDSETVRSLIGF